MVRYRENLTKLVDTVLSGPGEDYVGAASRSKHGPVH